MPNVKRKLNWRLLFALTITSLLLAVVVGAVIDTGKPYSVRVIDNAFIGATFMLAFSLLFRVRSGAMTKSVEQLNVERKSRRLKKEEAEQIRRYEVWRMFSVHFGWCSLVLYLLSAVGTVLFTMLRSS